MRTSVLVVEDEPEFMCWFADAVLADPGLKLAGVVSTGGAAPTLLDVAAPNAMLVDRGLPDISGIEVIRHAARQRANCDFVVVVVVVVVMMLGDGAHVMASIEAGATGYLRKDATGQRTAGGLPISPSDARRVLSRFPVAVTPRAPDAPVVPRQAPSLLAQRETEILRLTARGLGFDTIVGLLDNSPHTVVAHVRKIYCKLAVHSRSEAVYEASQMGLL